MRYLIINNNTPFYTEWFGVENNWETGMMVVDLKNGTWWDNISGRWIDVEEDHL